MRDAGQGPEAEAASGREAAGWDAFILLLDDQRRHHPEHPMLVFSMRKDVAVEGPGTRLIAGHDHIPALARRDVQGIALPRLRLGPAVLVDDRHVHPLQ